MAYSIRYTEDALDDLSPLTRSWTARILDTVDRKLRDHPATPSRARREIDLAPPELEGAVQPFWELRIEDFRVFYNVDEDAQEVTVWGVRYKGRKTTEQTLELPERDEE